MRIRHMMRENPARVTPDTPFHDLLRVFRDMDSRLAYVTGPDGALLGVVSSYDILRALLPFYLDANLARALPEEAAAPAQAFRACAGLTAADIMTRRLFTVGPDDTFLAAEALFAERKVNALPVVDAAGRLLGEVTRRIIIKHLAGTRDLEKD